MFHAKKKDPKEIPDRLPKMSSLRRHVERYQKQPKIHVTNSFFWEHLVSRVLMIELCLTQDVLPVPYLLLGLAPAFHWLVDTTPPYII